MIKIFTIGFVLALLIISGCSSYTEKKESEKTPIQKTQSTENKETSSLKKFSSVDELNAYVKENSVNQGPLFLKRGGPMMEAAVTDVAGGAPQAGQKASEYSQTNVQVEDVDEGDFVKNDGTYIYVLAQDKLVIADAFPAESAKIISQTDLKGSPRELFVNNDRVVVFTDDYSEVMSLAQFDFVPHPTSEPRTHALVFDISDKEHPTLLKDYTVDGYYFQSRMIGDYVYMISKKDVGFYGVGIFPPMIKESGSRVVLPDVYYFDNPQNSYVFHTISSIDLKNEENINAKTFLLGYSDTLYVSENNMYIAYQKSYPWRWYNTQNEDRFFDVIVPLLPQQVKQDVEDIQNNKNFDSYEKWAKISSVLEKMYNTMEEKEKQNFVDELNKAVDDYEIKQEVERRKTIIHKIIIDNGDIEYDNEAEVPGYLLNQFSLDEFGGNLRVATTTELYFPSGSEMYNNVFVFDNTMKVIGKVEDIAPKEQIYSTRFIADRLYMVTFQRVDPLFVIDLSDPENPKILGELKIPGFSDYLHPYDKDHLIGIGKETGSNDWGGISTKGVKIALFDVSDFEHPKQIDSYEIGESGTDSEALRDHKAFLFDKRNNLLVIPIREVKGDRAYNSKYGYYYQKVWQGAYVLNVSPEEGISVRGKISHAEDDEQDEYYWNAPSAVRRSLYMDNVLYTISAEKINMNDLSDLKDIGEIDLPFTQDEYYKYQWY